MTPEAINELIKNPAKLDFQPPETEDEKLEQFYNCIRMILVDVKVQESEIDFCKIIKTTSVLPLQKQSSASPAHRHNYYLDSFQNQNHFDKHL